MATPEQCPAPHDFQSDIGLVGGIDVVPTILDVVCSLTGMGFAAVARVTEERWVACSVLDKIGFGLKPGGELKVDTTICHEIRANRELVAINHVSASDKWRCHPTPLMYGFQSYISAPIILADGEFFGTLCAIDPNPARVESPEIVGMFQLFAQLIAKSLDASRKLAAAEEALAEERAVSELREQFIAVLGHDLRTPLRAISCFTELLMQLPMEDRASRLALVIKDSATRMNGLIESLLDLARGRLGGGFRLHRDANHPLEPVLRGAIAELAASHPDRAVEVDFRIDDPIDCDRSRIVQLFTNLLENAMVYGAKDRPVSVTAVGNSERFQLSVTNHGDPIPPAALERLFQPFYRTLHNGEGLGLGLYIAQEIATAHGGSLTAACNEGRTTFTLRLPAANVPALLPR